MSNPAPDEAAITRELEQVYADLEAEIGGTVRCDLRGLCCDFEKAQHVLMATGLEVDYARTHAPDTIDPTAAPEKSCPYFVQGTCHLRDGRPLGCRVYFCDPAYADRMNEVAERYHRRVVAIHERHGLDYRYRPFVVAVREKPA